MTNFRTIEAEIAYKLKKKLEDEFEIFCEKHKINLRKLLIKVHLGLSKNICRTSLLSYNQELYKEWIKIENNILITYLLRYIKILDVNDYQSLRCSFSAKIPRYFVKDSSYLYASIKDKLHDSYCALWEYTIVQRAVLLN